jgi:hypothetical protein
MPSKIVHLPGLGDHEDVSNFLDRGGTVDQILLLTNQAKIVTADDLPLTEKRPRSHHDPYRPHDPRLVAVFQERLKLPKSARGQIMLCCPFHVDANPSLSLDLDRLLWHCFGCGLGGGPLEFFIRWKQTHDGVTLTRRSAWFRLQVTYL